MWHLICLFVYHVVSPYPVETSDLIPSHRIAPKTNTDKPYGFVLFKFKIPLK
jgi:hypothetical protein